MSGRPAPEIHHVAEDALLAEPLAVRPRRIGQTVGEETQNRLAALERQHALLPATTQAQRRAGGLEPRNRPGVRRHEKRVRMPRVRVRERSLCRIGYSITQRQKHLRLFELLGQRCLEAAQRLEGDSAVSAWIPDAAIASAMMSAAPNPWLETSPIIMPTRSPCRLRRL